MFLGHQAAEVVSKPKAEAVRDFDNLISAPVAGPVNRSWDSYDFDWTKTAKLAAMHGAGLYGLYLLFFTNVHPYTKFFVFVHHYFCGMPIRCFVIPYASGLLSSHEGLNYTAVYKSSSTGHPLHPFIPPQVSASRAATTGCGPTSRSKRPCGCSGCLHSSVQALVRAPSCGGRATIACTTSLATRTRSVSAPLCFCPVSPAQDPYPIVHGFWWAHIGWLMFTKSKTCLEAGKKLEEGGMLDDLKAQRLVRLQHKYYGLVFLSAAFVYPALVSALWGETLWNGIYFAGAVPLFFSFQSTMCVNSLAHMWGERCVFHVRRLNLSPRIAHTTPRSRQCRTSSWRSLRAARAGTTTTTRSRWTTVPRTSGTSGTRPSG